MISCTRRLEFDYGHRLLRHESKCAHIHGHRGAVEVTVTGPLDHVGRVLDFGVIKERLGGWIDAELDHAFIVNREDARMLEFLVSQRQRHYMMPCEPSAENLVQLVGEMAIGLIAPIRVVHVRFYETPNGWADWRP